MNLHHVQVSCPPGGEAGARRFYAAGLGMREVPKPAGLAGRGGAWFRGYDGQGRVGAEIHVGVEDPFVPARRAHPAFLVEDRAELEKVAARLEVAGFDVDWTERDSLPDFLRFHTRDAGGNRVEVLGMRGAGR